MRLPKIIFLHHRAESVCGDGLFTTARYCHLRKITYICSAVGHMPMVEILFDESVLAFILERKCGSFQNTRMARHSYSVLLCLSCRPCTHPNTSVGYCLFVFGSFHNLRSDRLIISTLSLF